MLNDQQEVSNVFIMSKAKLLWPPLLLSNR